MPQHVNPQAYSTHCHAYCLLMQQILANQLLGMYNLKCEIASQLGACYKLMADLGRARAEFEKGVQVCKAGERSSEKELLQHWMCCFYFKLVDILSIEGSAKDVLAALARGTAFAQQHGLLEQQVRSQGLSCPVTGGYLRLVALCFHTHIGCLHVQAEGKAALSEACHWPSIAF